jgi:hypothetical protein
MKRRAIILDAGRFRKDFLKGNMMTDSRMTLKKWYKGITVPKVNGKNYPQFIASCVGIVNKIVEKEISTPITVKFGQCSTAYADQNKNLIVISRDFASGDFTQASGKHYTSSEDVIPQILGIIIHEAAHFAYSPPTLDFFADKVEKLLGEPVHKQVAMILANTVEDIYIEAEVVNQIPAISWMLERLNSNILGKDYYLNSNKNLVSQDSRPETATELQQVVGHLIFAKIHNSVPCNPYIDGLFNLAQSARTLHNVEDRIALVAKLYKAVFPELTKEEAAEDGEEQESEAGEAGESSGMNAGEDTGASQDGSEASDDVSDEDIAEAMDNVQNAPVASSDSYKDTWLDHKTQKINEMLKAGVESLEEDKLWNSDYLDGEYSKNVVTPTMHSEELEIDSRYAGLAKVGRQRATTNKPYGLDQRRGHSIRKLHRIATDGRIFAESVQTQSYKPMEVVILIDCSGSMWSGNKIKSAASAVIGATAGLKEARCEVRVLGHTADINGITLTLYNFKEWNDPITVASRRLRTVVRFKSDYPLVQNRDHLAIQEAAKEFRSNAQQRRRLLIVVSDGEPCANGNYYGSPAREATRKAVEQVRADGKDVISISITKEAMDANDYIYGPENNVCNEDVNVIEEVCRKLIRS